MKAFIAWFNRWMPEVRIDWKMCAYHAEVREMNVIDVSAQTVETLDAQVAQPPLSK
jgi:hypothetical protein